MIIYKVFGVKFRMMWYGISGSWRTINETIKNDVKSLVEKIIEQGDGIVTGGALGVDYIATQIILEKGDIKNQLKVFLPIEFDSFVNIILIDIMKGNNSRTS